MELRATVAATRKNVSSREKGQIEDGGTGDRSSPKDGKERQKESKQDFVALIAVFPVFPFPSSSFQTRLK